MTYQRQFISHRYKVVLYISVTSLPLIDTTIKDSMVP